MAIGTGTLLGGVNIARRKLGEANTASDLASADAYRAALEKAVYGGLAPAFNQGISGIEGYLSRSGPLADSGARAALMARLASNLYGGAASQVGQGYASYLGNVMNQRRQYAYQLALMKAQAKANKKGPLDYLSGLVGGVGGYALGGGKIPSIGGGYGGGTFGNDSLYYG